MFRVRFHFRFMLFVQEGFDHLFLHCDVTSHFWGHFLKVCGIAWCLPSLVGQLFDAWKGYHLVGCGLIPWKFTLFLFYGLFFLDEYSMVYLE